MEQNIIFNGRQPKNYIEAVLFYLANGQDGQRTIQKVSTEIIRLKEEITRQQIMSAFSNFKRMKIIDQLGKGHYYIDAEKARAFAKEYIEANGRLSIWNTPKGKARVASNNTRLIDTARAIFAAYEKPLSFRDVVNIAKRYDLKLSYGSASMLKYRDGGKELKTDPLKNGQAMRFTVTPDFYSKNASKINYFVSLLPHRKNIILAHFNRHVPELVKKYFADSQESARIIPEPKEIKDKAPPATMPIKFMAVDITRAIVAAYDGPLSVKAIRELAAQHDYRLKKSIVGWYRNNKAIELENVSGTDCKVYLYEPSGFFWQTNLPRLALFIDILPSRKNYLIERFKKNLPPGVVDGFTAKENINIEDPAIDEDRPPIGKPLLVNIREKESTGAQESASPPEDQQAAIGIQSAETSEDVSEDINAVDAANVGASILAYLNKLKSELRTVKQASVSDSDQGTIAELNKKVESLASSLVGMKAERNNAQFQVTKMEKIIEEKDRRLTGKDKRIEELERKLENAHNHIPKTFKLSEVARMTNLIKEDRIR
jgi:hypothetical protein